MVKSIKISELFNLSNINIIDLRSVEKYNSNHIPNSINVPSDKLLLNPSYYLDIDKCYYLYCQHGFTSYNVCSILSRLGYNVFNISGGYEEWLFNKE